MGEIFIFSPKSFIKLFGIKNAYKIDSNTIYYRSFSQKKNINHISDAFEDNGKMRSWEDLRAKLDFDDHKKLISLNQKTSNLLFGKIK